MATNTITINAPPRGRKSIARKEGFYSQTIESRPITANFDPKALGKAPAEALARGLRKAITSVKRRVAPVTYKKRLRAGRTSDRWLNDTGTLLGLSTRYDTDWTVNAPVTRLVRETFGHGFDDFITGFRQLIDLRAVTRSREYKAALRKSAGRLATVAKRKSKGGIG